MNGHQRLFLVQARSTFTVFELLRSNTDLPACHTLHCLQMATELLGKASAARLNLEFKSHRALVPFLKGLSTNREAQSLLGYKKLNAQWNQMIRVSIELAARIERLAPTLAGYGENPEYPWPSSDPRIAPAEHNFEIWSALQEPAGRRFLDFLRRLLDGADHFL